MKVVDLYRKVRHAVRIAGLSERAAARRFGIDPRTVHKMMEFSVPPGYVRQKPPAKPKLDRFIAVIDHSLIDDGAFGTCWGLWHDGILSKLAATGKTP